MPPSSSSYTLRLRASDPAGNRSAWVRGTPFTLTLSQENAAKINYTGAWSRVKLVGASGGSVDDAKIKGRKVTFTFTGSSIALVSALGADRGMATITVDGRNVATLDLYAKKARPRRSSGPDRWSRVSTP